MAEGQNLAPPKPNYKGPYNMLKHQGTGIMCSLSLSSLLEISLLGSKNKPRVRYIWAYRHDPRRILGSSLIDLAICRHFMSVSHFVDISAVWAISHVTYVTATGSVSRITRDLHHISLYNNSLTDKGGWANTNILLARPRMPKPRPAFRLNGA